MYQFKEGDKVTIKRDICNRIGSGVILFVKNDSTNGLYIKALDFICTDPNHWQLVEPKERAIEDVRVGDVLENGENFPLTVESKDGNVVIASAVVSDDIILGLYHVKELKKAGWKIKQPEPEKEEEDESSIANEIVQYFFEKGTRVGKEDFDYVFKMLGKIKLL